jgi:transcriptional regulator with XRE-family HTH domain
VNPLHSDTYQYLLTLLKEARASAGITQTELSKLLGKPQSFVSKYERGERRLDVIEFLQVTNRLGADPHAVLRKVEKQLS